MYIVCSLECKSTQTHSYRLASPEQCDLIRIDAIAKLLPQYRDSDIDHKIPSAQSQEHATTSLQPRLYVPRKCDSRILWGQQIQRIYFSA